LNDRAIATTVPYVDKEEEMQNTIGITPSVKFEYWKPENAYKTESISTILGNSLLHPEYKMAS
jgi:hypothetical protein